MTTRCFTVVNVGTSGRKIGSSERSTKMISSSAWLTAYVTCSGKRRMFSVWQTRPLHGAA